MEVAGYLLPMNPDLHFDDLADELVAAFGEGVSTDWSDDRFTSLARRAFAVQYAGSSIYRRFCDGRGVTPASVTSWCEIPAVPATAWKVMDLVVEGGGAPQAVFRTSGTTRGISDRGRHLVRRLDLYRASALPGFAHHMIPELAGEQRGMTLLSLIPSPDGVPESSLSTMIGFVAEKLADAAHWLVEPNGAFDVDVIRDVVRATSAPADTPGRAVVLVGTALAFMNVLDALGDDRLELPDGARLMETGGFKGIDRSVDRDALYSRISRSFGVRPDAIVSEYGMTELLSQLYRPGFAPEQDEPLHVPPPWLRIQALDPTTLDPVGPETPGLLCFHDLANLGSVCAVLTEDMGVVTPEGVRLLGRAMGSEPRGCSRSMDELMSARDHKRAGL